MTRDRHRATAALEPARLLAVLLGLALVAVPQTVSAEWLQAGTGPGMAAAMSVPAPASAPGATKPVIGTTATITWTATPVGSRSATGYVVRRYSGTTLSPMTGSSSCLGQTVNGVANVVPTTSCTDERGLTGGTFTYTVQPVYEKWLGPASPASTPAV